MYKGDPRIIAESYNEVKVKDHILIVGDERYAEGTRHDPGTEWTVVLCTNENALEAVFTVSGSQAVINSGLCWIEGGSWEDAKASQRLQRKS